MAEKKPDLFSCTNCKTYCTKDDFTFESKDAEKKCKRCLRESKLEKSVSCLEKQMKTMTTNMNFVMERVSALEIDREHVVHGAEGGSSEQQKKREPVRKRNILGLEGSQKNDGDLVEKARGKEEKPAEQPKKEREPVIITAMAAKITYVKLAMREMEAEIKAAIEANEFFLIGVAKWQESRLTSLQEFEKREKDLDERLTLTGCGYELKLVTVYFTPKLTAKDGFAVETGLLRDKYVNDDYCLNINKIKDARCFVDNTRQNKEGIAFLRVYSKIAK